MPLDTAAVEEIRAALMRELESGSERTEEEILALIDRLVMREGLDRHLTLREKKDLRRTLFYSVRKLDVLQELSDRPEVTEIMVNGYRNIFYEIGGRLYRWDRSFSSRERLEDVVQQIAGRCNRVVNTQRPICDARLDDASRVNIVLDPVALDGPILTIRRFPEKPITMEELVLRGSLTQEASDYLRDLVGAAYSVVIGGGTSTGKTTFLNALSSCIPQGERVITIEDNAELQLQGIDNLVRLEARSENLEGYGAITIRDLIRSALRMRPDRLIIGEMRGAEAEDFLICLNTGHSGSLGTAHANSVQDMISRIEMMVLMGIDLPVPVIRRQIAAGIEILVHLERTASGERKVAAIAEILGMDGDRVDIQLLFERDGNGELRRCGELRHCKKLEMYYEKG